MTIEKLPLKHCEEANGQLNRVCNNQKFQPIPSLLFHSVLFHPCLDSISTICRYLESPKHYSFLEQLTTVQESSSGRWRVKTALVAPGDLQLYCPWTGFRSRYLLYSVGIYTKLLQRLQSALNVSKEINRGEILHLWRAPLLLTLFLWPWTAASRSTLSITWSGL